MTKAQIVERNEAIDRLRGLLNPGDTIYTILRHVSVVVKTEGGFVHPNWAIATAIGAKLNKGGGHDAIIVNGCGFDAGFEIAHTLGYVMFPDGFECTGERCPSNDHSNGDRNHKAHQHKEGGYAFRQEWL